MINIVVPMAGRGSRFSAAGYALPKPLIDVAGQPMIRRVVENIRPDGKAHRFVFLVLQEHLNDFPLKEILEEAAPGCVIQSVPAVTRGAAETVLSAERHLNGGPLVIANSDQWIDAPLTAFYEKLNEVDGLILTMNSSDSKWSYIERSGGKIVRVVEKLVVSNEATVGIYGFSKSSLFFDAAREMIGLEDLSNGEFYVAPVYSYLIRDKRIVDTMSIGSESDGMWGLGTPDDLAAFLDSSHAVTLP